MVKTATHCWWNPHVGLCPAAKLWSGSHPSEMCRTNASSYNNDNTISYIMIYRIIIYIYISYIMIYRIIIYIIYYDISDHYIYISYIMIYRIIIYIYHISYIMIYHNDISLWYIIIYHSSYMHKMSVKYLTAHCSLRWVVRCSEIGREVVELPPGSDEHCGEFQWEIYKPLLL